LCGFLIGKAGSIISDMIKTTGARIKFSQMNELFPGGSDRVVVITGSTTCVRSAVELIVSKLFEVYSYLHDSHIILTCVLPRKLPRNFETLNPPPYLVHLTFARFQSTNRKNPSIPFHQSLYSRLTTCLTSTNSIQRLKHQTCVTHYVLQSRLIAPRELVDKNTDNDRFNTVFLPSSPILNIARRYNRPTVDTARLS